MRCRTAGKLFPDTPRAMTDWPGKNRLCVFRTLVLRALTTAQVPATYLASSRNRADQFLPNKCQKLEFASDIGRAPHEHTA